LTVFLINVGRRAKSQEPRIKIQEPRFKIKEPRSKIQEKRTKIQEQRFNTEYMMKIFTLLTIKTCYSEKEKINA